MINIKYSIIDSYIDNIPLTKQSRIEYYQQCKSILDIIKKTIDLGYKTSSDIGTALKTIDLSKFKTSAENKANSLNQLKSFLIHIGYKNDSASCAIRALKSNNLSIRAKEVIKILKDS